MHESYISSMNVLWAKTVIVSTISTVCPSYSPKPGPETNLFGLTKEAWSGEQVRSQKFFRKLYQQVGQITARNGLTLAKLVLKSLSCLVLQQSFTYSNTKDLNMYLMELN